jgi:hypothetical protein
MMLEELQKGIISNSELESEHGNSRWKALEEKKMTKISGRVFDMTEESEILMPHPLKRYLRVGCATKRVVKEASNLPLIPTNQDASNKLNDIYACISLMYLCLINVERN